MNKKENTKKILLKIALIAAVVLIAAFTIYSLFFKVTYINCGVPTEVKESGRFVKIRLSHDDKNTWIKVPASYYSNEDAAYNIEKRGTRIEYMKACDIYTGKVLSVNDSSIETVDGIISTSKGTEFYKKEDSKLVEADKDDIIIGYSSYTIALDDSGKAGAVIINKPEISTIRVGISNSDFSIMEHSSLTFFPVSEKRLTSFYSASEDSLRWRYYSGEGMKVSGEGIDYTLDYNQMLTASSEDGYIVLTAYDISSDNQINEKEVIGKTQGRVTIQCLSDPLYIRELKRSNDYKPVYYGSLEITADGSSLKLVNEVDLEHYLQYVVPSQMIPSGGSESYKAQAVASRTTAIYNLLSGKYSKEGYHITDTSEAQSYNSQPATDECTAAINDTKGQVVTYDGKLIEAKYYSTSCGAGAPYNQVYYSGRKPSSSNSRPYLAYSSYSTPEVGDLSDEVTAIEFLKDWTIKSNDSNSPYYRWKFSLTGEQLSDTINANIYQLYTENKKMFQKKWYFNLYIKTNIPEEGLGTIQDIYVSKRGSAGNVLSLTLTCESGTYRVYGPDIIRKLLSPEELTVSLMYGSDTVMDSMPSAFFVLDKTTSSKSVKNVTIYGGGYGDGVGMSQYGAIGLVRSGKTYNEVLEAYYHGAKITSLESLYGETSK